MANTGIKSSKRLSYLHEVAATLAQKKTKLEFVKEKVRLSVMSGRMIVSDQLRYAERQAESHLAAAEEHFERLKSAKDDSWEEMRVAVDSACEDLSQSTKKIVARFC